MLIFKEQIKLRAPSYLTLFKGVLAQVRHRTAATSEPSQQPGVSLRAFLLCFCVYCLSSVYCEAATRNLRQMFLETFLLCANESV